ncbi:DUF1697 domain-containing protein [Companilactobacillus ginsenosidimutans]|uniref:Phosphopentomutase n=1 Tax=Companilactobacillus ginsenosidimutans TaxID=1007676 RepID=A0A0H4QKQ8_9LACO|nr:DUF1697 domain-containing protein [Companilactobacillus ginsenosidimutans]AKP67303.1 hypothetical protein ABM34_06965 [Companilactobacillus ginsenosidimutans]
MKYLVLFRGINVGGHSRVPMQTLRDEFTSAGYEAVHTYINSGNLFITSDRPLEKVESQVTDILVSNFDFPIDFRVLSESEYKTDLEQAPEWWGQDKTLRHNALFKLNSYEAKWDEWLPTKLTEYDQVKITQNAIFWTSTFKINYSKSFYSKLLGTDFYKQTSARNFNTTTKLATLF